MPLWTFVTDYEGGTYISQYEAENIPDAFRVARAAKDEFLSNVTEEEAGDVARITGTSNVFCAYGTKKKKPMLVNIVLTVP
jgi:hypothetical protein